MNTNTGHVRQNRKLVLEIIFWETCFHSITTSSQWLSTVSGWESPSWISHLSASHAANIPSQSSHSFVSDSFQPRGLQHNRPPCPSPTPGVYSNSCPSSWWCHPTISFLFTPFPFCLQSFPSSGSLPMSQLFASGGQNIGVSASTSVLPVNIQDWFPLGLTGCISFQSKRLSRVFSNTTVHLRPHELLQARILEWVAFPFSRGSSQPRDWTQVSCTAGGFFTNWAISKAPTSLESGKRSSPFWDMLALWTHHVASLKFL